MTHDCEIPHCGRRCPTCDERVTCMGPAPVAIACSVHDDECESCGGENPCRECRIERRRAA